MQPNLRLCALVCACVFVCARSGVSQERSWSVGVARINITPDYPIRLHGYGGRRTPSEGVAQPIWAKALAIGTDQEKPVVWITVDNLAVSAEISNEVAKRIFTKTKIARERIAVCSSHTHSAPCLTRVAPNIFSSDIIPEEQAVIDRYTKELIDKLEKVAFAALADRAPAHLAWGQGTVDFAQNRRTAGGATDHTLSLLRVTSLDGKIRALLVNYACHCTTLGGEFNQIHGDWAGCAQEAVEKEYPGAVALVAVGCGGDANPFPRGKVTNAVEHGAEIAAEAKRMLTQKLIPLSSAIECRTKQIELPFQEHFTRAQWEERAKQKGIVGHHARKNLARLDRGEKLPTSIPYLVQSWNFGKELALVFLPGEVVIDYQLRLKKEFDAARLWVNAYANDVPCYIPSKRVLAEGGYEAEDSLWYYDRPAKFKPEVEERIIAAVHDIMPKDFVFDAKKAEFPPPKSPAEALAAFRTKANFTVELVAAEPLIVDPVAIDFGPDGKLWVAEMHDYPSGLDGKGKPGGRIKYLQRSAPDGRYDKATLFLEGLPFPTGVMAWHKGALVCAAPDILYAEDTNGDGKADVVKKLYSGFATHNFQARVNGLSWGLDGWVYGAAGLFGGKILSSITGKETELSGRDFRIKPDTGEFEPVSGLSQQSRVRDDFGNWFGCDNSTLLWHFPMAEEYLRRNPHVPSPPPRYNPVGGSDPNRLFPVSRTLERFNDPQAANRTTSACGLEIYRDELLGAEYAGNAFVCEPVHNLVHRLVLKREGVTFSASRAEDEQRSEFLASTDNWFRPVQVRTGPDGALWVVDMYRFVIEHPRWIPAERLAKLDVRAGADKGRIYRIFPTGASLRTVPNTRDLKSNQLAEALDSPNGPMRDLIHRELLERTEPSPVPLLTNLASDGSHPAARVQALSVLAQAGKLDTVNLQNALSDHDPGVVRHAVALAEPLLSKSDRLAQSVATLADSPDAGIRFQAALSLGSWRNRNAGPVLGRLLVSDDQWLRAAALSSAPGHIVQMLDAVLANENPPAISRALSGLIATAVGFDDNVVKICERLESGPIELRLAAVESLVDAIDRTNLSPKRDFLRRKDELARLPNNTLKEARSISGNEQAPESLRLQAIRLLGRLDDEGDANLKLLVQLTKRGSPALGRAAVEALARTRHPSVPQLLIEQWPAYGPAVRLSVLNALLSRPAWVGAVLDAIAANGMSSLEVPLAMREQLLKSKDADVARWAHAIFGKAGSSDRAKVLADYHAATTLPGDRSRGAAVFEKLCSSCHALNGKGHAVGPDLAPLRDKPGDYMLMAILDPNAVIEPKFVNYQVETKDGRSLSGIIQSETATGIALLQPAGLKEEILRSQIESLKASSLSLMPEGLEQGATPQDFADLIAYLKLSGPARFGSASSQQAAAARAEFLKSSTNVVHKLRFASETLNYASWIGRLPLAHCRQTDGKSRVVWESTPLNADGKSVVSFRLPVAMGFISQPQGEFVLKINGRETLHFDVVLADHDWESANVHMHYTVMEANAEDSNGVLQFDLPASMIEAGRPVQFEVTASAARSERWFGIYLTGSGQR